MAKTLPGKSGIFVIKSIVIAVLIFVSQFANAGTLVCSITTAASCTGTVIYRMSGATNAHVQMPGQTNINYDNNVVCCSGVTGLSNSCVAPYDVALKLDKVTNAHVQKNSGLGYMNTVCISVPTGGLVTVGYVTSPTTCLSAGYDTTLGSINKDTNSHAGDVNAYNTKVCATAQSGPSNLPVSGTLTSSVFDTTASSSTVGYNSIMWKGALGGAGFNEGKVRFQLAASNSSTGPWNFYGGATCGSLDFFDTTGPNNPVELKGSSCYSNWNNKRYFKYKVQVCSNDCVVSGANTPTVDNIIVSWSP